MHRSHRTATAAVVALALLALGATSVAPAVHAAGAASAAPALHGAGGAPGAYDAQAGPAASPALTETAAPVYVGEIEPGGYEEVTITIGPDESSPGWDISDTTITGENAAAFTIASGGGAFELAPGEDHTVVVGFSADTLGTKTADLNFEGANTTYTLGLEGDVVENTSDGDGGGDGGTAPSLSFGNVSVGDRVTDTITIPNDMSRDVTATFFLEGGDAARFTVVSGGGTHTVPAGGSHTVEIAFEPDALGSFDTHLVADPEDDALDVLRADVSGDGVEGDTDGGDGGDGGGSTLAVRFGEVDVGDTATETLTLPNGLDRNVTVDLSVVGTDADQFRLLDGAGTVTIPAGGDHTVTVAYDPTRTGPANATLQGVPEDDSLSTLEAPITGSGNATGPAFTLSNASLAFGEVSINTTETRRLTVTNDGPTEATLVLEDVPGPFRFANARKLLRFEPNETKTVAVTFAPKTLGTVTTTADLAADADGQETVYELPLEGTGIDPEFAVTAPQTTLTPNDTTVAMVVTNPGTGPLRVSDTTVTGPFTLKNAGSFTVAPGGSRVVEVVYDPGASRVRSAVRFETNDADAAVVRVAIVGEPAGNATATVSVDGDTKANRTTVNVSVTDVADDSTVSVDTSTSSGEDGPTDSVAVDRLNVSVDDGDPFTLNVTSSDAALDTTPTFAPEDNTTGVGYVRVNHSVPDANVRNVSFTFRVPDARVPTDADGDPDPEEIVLYRYHDGAWRDLNTTAVRQTDDAWVFRAESPGLSAFSIGRQQPKFELQRAVTNVSAVALGEDVAVQVRITNVGSADGRYVAKLYLNGDRVQRKSATVPPNGTVELVFLHEFQEAGSYRVDVNNRTAGVVDVAPPDDDETTTDDGGDTPTDSQTSSPTDPGSDSATASDTDRTDDPDDQGAGGGVPVLPVAGAAALALVLGGGAVYRRQQTTGDDATTVAGGGRTADGDATDTEDEEWAAWKDPDGWTDDADSEAPERTAESPFDGDDEDPFGGASDSGGKDGDDGDGDPFGTDDDDFGDGDTGDTGDDEA